MAKRVGKKDFEEKVKLAECLVLTEWIDKYLKGADE